MENKNYKRVNLASADLGEKKLAELSRILPEAFREGKIDWQKIKEVLGSDSDACVEKFSFSWAGKIGAVKNVLVPSKATLKPVKDESVKFDESENIFIEGDNLEVLKLLQKAYFEKVKMIYIDPPYNTGGDFVYKDDFSAPLKGYLEQTGQIDGNGNKMQTNRETSGRYHSDWLSMMYPRLKLAWNLLRDDGVIFISIDDNEVHHLRMLMDEIFGEENFIAQFVWKRRASSAMSDNNVTTDHEYVICFQKGNFCGFLGNEKDFKNYLNPDNDKRGPWILGDLTVGMTASMRPNQAYDLIDPKTGKKYPYNPNRVWSFIPESMNKLIAENKIVFPEETTKRPMKKRFQGELKSDCNPFSTIMIEKVGLNTEATRIVQDIMGGNVFDYSKPLSLLEVLISQVVSISGNNKDEPDIVLDFFAGSATTAHAVLNLNKQTGSNLKFIMVQLPVLCDKNSEAYKAGYKTIADIAKERMRRVIKGYGEKPHPINDGFKVFRLDKSNYPENNFEFDPEISEEESKAAFLEYLDRARQVNLFEKNQELDVVYENIIKEGLSLNSKIEKQNIAGADIYKIADGDKQLLICLENKISPEAVNEFRKADYKGKIFICLDSALDDTTKENLALNVELKTI